MSKHNQAQFPVETLKKLLFDDNKSFPHEISTSTVQIVKSDRTPERNVVQYEHCSSLVAPSSNSRMSICHVAITVRLL